MTEDSRVVRNRILKILYEKHPNWTDDMELWVELGDLNCEISADRLASELIYLRDVPEKAKGYVELQIKTVRGEKYPQSRITPLGIDLYEKAVPADPRIAPF